MLRLVTLSAPLGGFFCGVQSPLYVFGRLPEIIDDRAAEFVYTQRAQEHLGLAGYWRDPYHL